MTHRQKEIVVKLLQGYTISNAGPNGIRLRNCQAQVVMKISAPTFFELKPWLRKSKGLYVINKSLVRQEHGNSFIKMAYKQLSKGTVPVVKQAAVKEKPKKERYPITRPGALELSFSPAPQPALVRTCRVCGCTENDACYHPKGGSCWWVEKDLCSHCHHWPGEGVKYSSLINGMTCTL